MDALNIRLLLDDSTPLSPDDAGGCVLIEGRGREARSDYCQVDRWLLELVDGISEFQTALEECWVDFAADGSEMRLSREGAVTKAEYRGASWTVPQDEFVAAAKGAAEELVKAFAGFRPFVPGSPLARLEEWLSLQG